MCFRADLGDVVKIPEPRSIFDFEPGRGGTAEERVQVRGFSWGKQFLRFYHSCKDMKAILLCSLYNILSSSCALSI